MAITFPAGPHTDGDIFTNTTTGVKYIYNAADDVWKTHVWPTNTNYLQLSGGTLTGNLSLGTNDLTAQDINSTTLTTTGGVTVGNGLTVSDGNVVMASGHGIDFSATANSSGTMFSELLDDYEEGTWTPTYSGLTAVTGRAHYIKIGKLVSLNLYFTATNRTTGSFDFTLPFVADTTSNTGNAAGVDNVGSIMMNNVTYPASAEQANTYAWDTLGYVFYSFSNNTTWYKAKGNDLGDANILQVSYVAAN